MRSNITFFLMIWACCAAAQCNYSQELQKGKDQLKTGSFKTAINTFLAARYCDGQANVEELNRLVVQAQDEWTKALDRQRIQTQKAREEAEKTQRSLDEQKEKTRYYAQLSDELTRSVEEYSQIAQRLGRMAEGLRLSLLSENLRSQGKKSQALALAYLSRQLLGLEDPEAARAFGAAARDSFSQALKDYENGLSGFQLLPGGSKIMAFLPDGKAELLGFEKNRAASASLLGKAKDTIRQVIYSPDGRTMLTYSESIKGILWNSNGQSLAQLSGHTEAWLGAAFSPDGQKIVSCSRDNTARLWSIQGQVLQVLNGHTGNVYEARFSPDGSKVLTRSSDGTVRVWDVQSGSQMGLIEPKAIYTHAAQFSPDGQAILTAGADGSLHLWGTKGEDLGAMREHQAVVKAVQFSPSGDNIISYGLEPQAKLWTKTGALAASLPGHQGQVLKAVFNPKSDRIATASADQKIKVWDLQGKCLLTLEGHQAGVSELRFSPDGQLLLSTAQDGYARLWNQNGQLLLELDLEKSSLPALFSADGKSILYAQGNVLKACPTPSAAYEGLEVKGQFAGVLERVKVEFGVRY
jgi:WD40 repeat protein